jgi:hypothetical protein
MADDWPSGRILWSIKGKQAVTVSGVFNGCYGDFIALENCIFIDPKPDQPSTAPELTVTADQMEKDYASDKEAADKKYKDKVVRMTGVMDKEHGEKFTDVAFKVDGEILISADVTEKYQDQARAVKDGQPITVEGNCSGFIKLGVLSEAASVKIYTGHIAK